MDLRRRDRRNVIALRHLARPFCLVNTAHPAGGRLALVPAGLLRVLGSGPGLDLPDKGNGGHVTPLGGGS